MDADQNTLSALLAARERTIAVLTERIERSLNEEDVGVASVLHSNLALEQIVQNKTRELEQTYAALKNAQAEVLQASKLTAIGQLAAGIAHEINTPIQYVSDNASFLQGAFAALSRFVDAVREATQGPGVSDDVRGRIAEDIRDLELEYIVAETPRAIEHSLDGLHRVSEIVGAMKAFSHPSGGAKRPTDLAECITSTATIARNTWRYVAELETHFDASMPPVSCLRDELNQVILNLIVNAADAIAEQNGKDSAKLGRIAIATRRDAAFAEIRVSDTGAGMSAAVRSRIFEPFFTTKGVGKGTGQGLAIAYSVIVDKHGGTITVESEVGKGSTFIIRIPIQEGAQQ